MENFPEHHVFLLRFLELIKNREREKNGTAAFIDYFDSASGQELYVNATDMDSVKLLTVHKSKGLQFPVVIIPFLDMDITLSGKDAAPYHLGMTEKGLSLVHLKKDYAKHSPGLETLYREKYRENFINELNVVYVALTRPQKELYVFVPKKAARSNNPVCTLMPGLPVEKGVPVPAAGAKKAARSEPAHLAMTVPVYKDLISLLKDEVPDPSSLANRKNIEKGEIMHCMLSFIGNLEGLEVNEALANARQELERAYPDANGADLERLTSELVQKPDLREFFFIEDGEVFREKEIVSAAGITRRIDRLIVNGSEVRVVDYKSSADNSGKQQKQVLEYMSLLSHLYPEHAIKGYLLYFDTMTTEEVK